MPPGPVPVPGGGVPLNMREVEELERMTKNFIKDMDTHAPVVTSTPTGRSACHRCSGRFRGGSSFFFPKT